MRDDRLAELAPVLHLQHASLILRDINERHVTHLSFPSYAIVAAVRLKLLLPGELDGRAEQ